MPETDYRWKFPLRDRLGRIVAFALVDEADYWALSGSWWLSKNGYAVGRRGGRHMLYLHREVLGLKRGDGKAVDHKNRDKLDNRRSNLRIVTRAVNAQNRGSLLGSSSRYRGVDRLGARRWRAQSRDAHLGVFASELDAAAAAAQYRQKHLPGTVEDPELLAHVPGPRCPEANPRQLTNTQAFLIRWLGLTTTLSHAKIADLLGLSKRSFVSNVLSGRSYQNHATPYPHIHSAHSSD